MKIRFLIRFALVFILAVTVVFFSSCEKNNESSDKPIIAVSILPVKTFVEEVCGEEWEVVSMVDPGYSPEGSEISPNKLVALDSADLYFTVGVPVEETVLENLSEKTSVIKLEDEVRRVYDDLYIGKSRDPHIWLSPKRVMVMIESVTEALIWADPENEAFYRDNAREYIEKIENTDREIRQMLDGKENIKFIVFHPAFGYLADEYSLEMYALQEEGKEATAKGLEEMIDFAKEEGIKVIFYQDEVDSHQSETFAREIGGVTKELSPLSPDYLSNLKLMIDTIVGEN